MYLLGVACFASKARSYPVQGKTIEAVLKEYQDEYGLVDSVQLAVTTTQDVRQYVSNGQTGKFLDRSISGMMWESYIDESGAAIAIDPGSGMRVDLNALLQASKCKATCPLQLV